MRNPVDRALSHYHHEVALGREPLPFEQALDDEETRMEGELERMRDPRYFSHAWWNFTYQARGRYAEQLERWLELYPRERLLVIPSEDLLERPGETYAQVLEFLGAPPHELDAYPRVFEREYAADGPRRREAGSASTSPSRTAASTSCSAATSAGASSPSFSALSIALATVAASLGAEIAPASASPPTCRRGWSASSARRPLVACESNVVRAARDLGRSSGRSSTRSASRPGMLSAADLSMLSLSQPVFSAPWLS